ARSRAAWTRPCASGTWRRGRRCIASRCPVRPTRVPTGGNTTTSARAPSTTTGRPSGAWPSAPTASACSQAAERSWGGCGSCCPGPREQHPLARPLIHLDQGGVVMSRLCVVLACGALLVSGLVRSDDAKPATAPGQPVNLADIDRLIKQLGH